MREYRIVTVRHPIHEEPFMTIVVRCFRKPKCLRNNRDSIMRQTDHDFERVYIIDPVGYGLGPADEALDQYKHLNMGKYIVTVDDDDYIVDPNFIRKVKVFAERENYPDAIIWRGRIPPYDQPLPRINDQWGKRPHKCQIGSFCFGIKREVYNEFVCNCRTGKTGDFDFINSIWKAKKQFGWMKDVFMACQQKSYGNSEDCS